MTEHTTTITPEAAKSFLAQYYQQLTGFVITKVEVNEEDDFGHTQLWPVLWAKHPKTGETARIEVSQDEEGNGPGFLFIS